MHMHVHLLNIFANYNIFMLIFAHTHNVKDMKHAQMADAGREYYTQICYGLNFFEWYACAAQTAYPCNKTEFWKLSEKSSVV